MNQANSSTVTVIHSGNPTTDIAAGGVTSVALGSTVHDKATVSGTGAGTPTGKVDFTFFTSNDCTTGGTAAGTDIVLDANGVAHPSSTRVRSVQAPTRSRPSTRATTTTRRRPGSVSR